MLINFNYTMLSKLDNLFSFHFCYQNVNETLRL